MNDEDLRDLFAAFALMGNVASSAEAIVNCRECAEYCYDLADAMIETKYAKEEQGITSVIKRTRKKNV